MTKCVQVLALVALIGVCPVVGRSESFSAPTLPQDGEDLGERFRRFADLKMREVHDVARAKGIAVPSVVPLFFAAVRSNQWARAEDLFVSFKDSARRQQRNDDAALAVGMQDVSGVYDLMADWSPALIDAYCAEALRAIPDGSIVFGGSDEGRFFITYGAATLRTGQVTVITQNALADNTYADYVRATTSNTLSMFTTADSESVFREYVEDVKAGRRDAKGSMSFAEGRAKITGAYAVMEINGILARRLFERNRSRRQFYVEESYIIEWMYDYLLPHGLVMKLNSEPVGQLGGEVVSADAAYWRNLEARLKAIPDSAGTEAARLAFSRCRCAIAGLYAHRGMLAETESAFRQALRLCPQSAEARFRLADHFKKMKDYAAAGKVMSEFLVLGGLPSEQVGRVTQYLKELRQLRDGTDNLRSSDENP